MREVTDMRDLAPGFTYATCWKAHRYEYKRDVFQYLSVKRVDPDAVSGELVVTNSGNRSFSRLRWFGPLPARMSDLPQSVVQNDS